MQQRPLGRTGLCVSSIGLGCVTFGREIDADTSFAILDHARDGGINLLDTAASYGEGASETVLGRWLSDRGCREQVVLASKVSSSLAPAAIAASVEGSLRRLRTDCIDLLQFHAWDDQTPVQDSLAAVQREIEKGRVRFVGCSNWAAWQLSKALILTATGGSPRIETVQPIYSLVHREIEAEMLPLCVDQQVGVISYSPLGAGFITGKYGRNSDLPKGTRFDIKPAHQSRYFTENGWRTMEAVRNLSQQTGHTMVRLALGWVLAQPGITSMLIGARKVEHVSQAFEADREPLRAELLRQMGQLSEAR